MDYIILADMEVALDYVAQTNRLAAGYGLHDDLTYVLVRYNDVYYLFLIWSKRVANLDYYNSNVSMFCSKPYCIYYGYLIRLIIEEHSALDVLILYI